MENLKKELLERIDKYDSFNNTYLQIENATTLDQLAEVIKTGFYGLTCSSNAILTGEFIDKYSGEFEAMNIFHNRNLNNIQYGIIDSQAFLFGKDEYCVEDRAVCTVRGYAIVHASDESLINAFDTSCVESEDYVSIWSYNQSMVIMDGYSRCVAFHSSEVIAREKSTCIIWGSKVKCSGYNKSVIISEVNANIKTHDDCILRDNS
jgi:hypothetical protein